MPDLRHSAYEGVIFSKARAVADLKWAAVILIAVMAAQVNEIGTYVAAGLLVLAVVVEPGRRFEPPVRFKGKR